MRRPFLVFGVAVAAWLLLTIGWRPLAMPDEGRYGGIALDMLAGGDWATPLINGMPFFHKPPLFYWIGAAAMQVFGAAPWVARLPSALGAWLMAAGWFLLLYRHAGSRMAWLGGLVLATLPLFFGGAQYANLDMLVAGLIACTIMAAAHAVLQQASGHSYRAWVWLAYALAALGLLAKGLIGIVLPGGVLVAWLLWQRHWRGFGVLLLSPIGWLLLVALALPWFLVMEHRFAGFFHYFFVYQHFQRFSGTGFNNALPFWFYPAVLVALCLPWSLWLLAALKRGWQALGRLQAVWQGTVQPVPMDGLPALLRLSIAWLGVITLFFSLPESKLVGYILPVLPAWSLLLALCVLSARQAPQQTVRQADRSGTAADATTACPALPRPFVLTALASTLLCVGTIAAVAWTRPAPARAAAVLLQNQMQTGDQLVMLEEFASDLRFYAHSSRPAWIITGWDDAELMGRDTWRKELQDAGKFMPDVAMQALITLPQLQQRLCQAGAAQVFWLWGSPSAATFAAQSYLQAVPPVWQSDTARSQKALWRVTGAQMRQLPGCK